MATHRGTLRVPFGSPEAAERARAALAPDDDAHVTTRVEPKEGAVLVVEAQAGSPGSLLAALDDVLAALSVMEDVASMVEEP